MPRRVSLVALVLLILTPPPWGRAQENQDSLERDYGGELPRLRPLEPEEALGSFEVHPDFRIELVAAEPLVHDPVAMAFDASGHLYVVEMRGYSEQREEDLGAVRLLRDTDGDGTFDTSDVFLDGLRWPTAVACWKGGVFVAVAPDILYAKDTDGDHRADRVETVYTGFHTTNVQGLMNTFKWGLDNRIQGSASLSGGGVVRGDQTDAPPLTLRGRDFSFDPRTREIRAESGGGQHGLTFDEWGRKFVCHNSHQVIYVAYEDGYVARNPFMAAPAAAVDAAADGPSGDVFRISPVEPWRVVRTRLRVKGLVPGPIEGGGTASGYFTSATGITVYKGDAWPEEYRGQVIVGDVGSNLVHRKTVDWPGVIPVTSRARAGTEFVRSTDNWFRPAQFCNGPDGGLYVADMYREVIEHPASLPPLIKRHLDLTSGQDRGRIYRIVPREYERKGVPNLARAESETLVELLSHPNAWHRETASRLLFERQGEAPGLAEVAVADSSPLGRVHGLYVLDGLGQLSPDVVSRALTSPHPRVREHGVRLASRFLPGDEALAARVAALAQDTDPLVRFRVAFVLGDSPSAVAHPALASLIRRDPGDPWLRMAVLTSATPVATDLVVGLLDDRTDDAHRTVWLGELARLVGAASPAESVSRLVSHLDETADESGAEATLLGMMEGARLARRSPELTRLLTTSRRASRILDGLLARARAAAVDDALDGTSRADAVRTLALGPFESESATLATMLDPRQPLEVQQATVSTLGRFDDQGVAPLLLQAWPSLAPWVRADALEVLFASVERLGLLLDAIEEGQVAPMDLDSTRVQQLLQHPSPVVSRRSRAILGDRSLGRREEVVISHRDVLDLTGNPSRGQPLFEQNCAQCHRLEGVGHSVGPDLETVARSGSETILTSVLDPNREVNPQYVNYVVDTVDWGSYSGIIASEAATSMTLLRAGGAEDTILKQDIETIRSTGLSIMPEGWEETFTRQQLADLLAFITSLAR